MDSRVQLQLQEGTKNFAVYLMRMMDASKSIADVYQMIIDEATKQLKELK